MYWSQSEEAEFSRRWKDSGVVESGSAPEFFLRMNVLNVTPEYRDLEYLVDYAVSHSEFCGVLSEIVRDTPLFDKALSEKVFYIDYYMAQMRTGRGTVDPDEYGRAKLLDAYETGKFGRISDTGNFRDFMLVCADKTDSVLKGRLKHIGRFREWLASRRTDKCR